MACCHIKLVTCYSFSYSSQTLSCCHINTRYSLLCNKVSLVPKTWKITNIFKGTSKIQDLVLTTASLPFPSNRSSSNMNFQTLKVYQIRYLSILSVRIIIELGLSTNYIWISIARKVLSNDVSQKWGGVQVFKNATSFCYNV